MNISKNDSAKDALPSASTNALNGELIIKDLDLLPGDVLLYRPSNPSIVQKAIVTATHSPYTHAAIYLGDGYIAESGAPQGVTKNALEASLRGSQCVAVLRSQLGFGHDRPARLVNFVDAVLKRGESYNFFAAVAFPRNSAHHFANQLKFIRENYGKVTSHEDFAEQSFFCSAFVVACYAVVGIIGETAQVAYQPNFFSPGHLYQDPTFGWLLGYLLPEDGAIPPEDPPLSQATLWRDVQDSRWW